MAFPQHPRADWLVHLERCWRQECDLDPMILRARRLRQEGCHPQALCLEEELLPMF